VPDLDLIPHPALLDSRKIRSAANPVVLHVGVVGHLESHYQRPRPHRRRKRAQVRTHGVPHACHRMAASTSGPLLRIQKDLPSATVLGRRTGAVGSHPQMQAQRDPKGDLESLAHIYLLLHLEMRLLCALGRPLTTPLKTRVVSNGHWANSRSETPN